MAGVFDFLEEYGDRMAILGEEGVAITYSELVRIADNIGARVESRSLVFLLTRNSVESIAAYVGFLRRRVVPLLLNSTINNDSLRKLAENYRPQYIFGPSELWKDHDCRITFTFGSYALIATNYQIDYELNNDLGLLLTTSGSTGSPKLVRQSYGNVISNTRSICKYLEISSEDRAITTLPMNYTYGLSIITTHLFQGAAIVATDKTLISPTFWDRFTKHEVTTFGGVPYTYEILKRLQFGNMDLPSLRYITQAGGKLQKALCEEFATLCYKKGIRMIVMYGQTEATARMSFLPRKYAFSKAGSIGIPIPGGEFWLEDANGRVIKQPGVVGELVYKGANVTLGYAENRHDLSRGDDNRGVLRTGDMAKVDNDGFYYIVGRKKRFLKIYGSRVNLDELEDVLRKKGYDCACLGEDDDLKIFVAGCDKIEKVRDFVKTRTEINPAGFSIYSVASIPRNPSGKILYAELK